ncbi:TRAP transporter large permease [Pseudodonghicola flavimaris]|uniref:TRAP transporter large permease protein n=1 Tax=Pseudodonghicola flavimaris TaxID=3050036 RepID=A0ABT7F2Z2_9RHOB|nr:TRAP transporter large permease [Pseudodonghicola flavimaris]MDK3018824.1 TRAP transporter large permease [Pseudodonghicola flavimaris]
MDPLTVAGIGFALMFALIALHVPIGIAMGFVGVGGFAFIVGWQPALSLLASEPAATLTNLNLAVIPLFMLMGNLAAAAGLANDVYNIAHAFIGHRKGGLATATVLGSGGFGAVCGSGVATTATFGRVALPEMLERGYAPSLASGAIAAGGTLGIIVPPSTIMVLYAILTEQFVVDLFTAALIPALLAVLLYALAVRATVTFNRSAAAEIAPLSWRDRLAALRKGWGVVLLSVVVLGGIYAGIFTVNEAAAVGVVVSFVFLLARRGLDVKELTAILVSASTATAMIYVMVFGATIFSYFMTITDAPAVIVDAITAMDLPPLGVIVMFLLLYIVLGAFFDEVAAMIITIPFVIPVVQHLGFDLVWWGIINVIVIEIGMITPPIGINVMVLNAMRRDIALPQIYKGIFPFFIADMIRLAILVAFPALTLWLPRLLQ